MYMYVGMDLLPVDNTTGNYLGATHNSFIHSLFWHTTCTSDQLTDDRPIDIVLKVTKVTSVESHDYYRYKF